MRYTHFSKSERLELSILLKKGYSLRTIASTLKRSHSSVIREIKRNSVKDQYDPHKSNHKAYVRRWKSKYRGMKVKEHPWIEKYIQTNLKKEWTPEEIAGRLRLEHGRPIVSFKTISKYLYSSYGVHYCQYLVSRRQSAKKRGEKKHVKVLIPNRTPIEMRPFVVNERMRCGDFEGDTLGVPKETHGTIAGAVDRKSRYFLAKKIPALRYAMEGFETIFDPIIALSLTLDNGVENVRYETLGIPTYFCNPYSSWEKGSIENTFQRLRRWIPKKTAISSVSEKELCAIVHTMNATPRKCLGYRTPQEVFEEQPRRSILIPSNGWCTSG